MGVQVLGIICCLMWYSGIFWFIAKISIAVHIQENMPLLCCLWFMCYNFVLSSVLVTIVCYNFFHVLQVFVVNFFHCQFPPWSGPKFIYLKGLSHWIVNWFAFGQSLGFCLLFLYFLYFCMSLIVLLMFLNPTFSAIVAVCF